MSIDIKVSDDFDSSLHELKFHCSECTDKFSSESNLKVHLKDKRWGNPKREFKDTLKGN